MPAKGQQDAVVRAHRSALKTARRAISRWAGKDDKRRTALLILAGCGSDRHGDTTLDAVAAVFEEFELPDEVVRALDALTSAAHRLWTRSNDGDGRSETEFAVGEVVTACESVQGLTKGMAYRVTDVDVERLAFGTFVAYSLRPVERPTDDEPAVTVTNGHLLLDREPDEARRSAKQGRSYYLGEDS